MLPLHDQTGPFRSQIAIPTDLFQPGHWYGHVLLLSCLVGPFSQDYLDRPWPLRLRENREAFSFSPPGESGRHPSFQSRLPATPGLTLQRRRQQLAAIRRGDAARHPLAHAHATVPCDLVSRYPYIHRFGTPKSSPYRPACCSMVRNTSPPPNGASDRCFTWLRSNAHIPLQPDGILPHWRTCGFRVAIEG
ncbi:hypothetical protein BDP81DRAFT_65009 [Colletotrichum phormii]|uniref:Uncharacterized protein n=1 Tax=Colletotrichum phormii TaxID=359342 RepID=A0AAI9ZLV8_9PEZI|nr:uncharacterized protein BDP81DRAFT_65009 [Colletotrichum phormii]KAK1634050.1 hypothetical protein BDP81DRAFT_65009 [Colletotrichum phormii]